MIYGFQPIVVGDTIDFELTAQKDGAIWDLTNGVVSLYLVSPNRSYGPLNANIYDPTNGKVKYQCTTSMINTNGVWKRQWKIADQFGTILWSDIIQFNVQGAFGA